jgi:hypothetical protein
MNSGRRALVGRSIATEQTPVRACCDAHRWPCCDRPSLGCCHGPRGSWLLGESPCDQSGSSPPSPSPLLPSPAAPPAPPTRPPRPHPQPRRRSPHPEDRCPNYAVHRWVGRDHNCGQHQLRPLPEQGTGRGSGHSFVPRLCSLRRSRCQLWGDGAGHDQGNRRRSGYGLLRRAERPRPAPVARWRRGLRCLAALLAPTTRDGKISSGPRAARAARSRRPPSR